MPRNKARSKSKRKTTRRGVRYCVFRTTPAAELVAHFERDDAGRNRAENVARDEMRRKGVAPGDVWIAINEITWKE